MMSRFYADHLKGAPMPGDKPKEGASSLGLFGGIFGGAPKLELRAFIAQMATGEGKSIVIAMLAVFMVQLHGLRVHVLENNEGLLERDFATYRPFFEAFGIRCGVDLLDPEAQVVYCLKSRINHLFMRKMLEGQLDEVLGRTVIIVDEVDDLVVNENPNSNYVKEDAERTPDLRKCFAALKADEYARLPRGVHDVKLWEQVQAAFKEAKAKRRGEDYRVVEEQGKKVAVILVDGVIPKVSACMYGMCMVYARRHPRATYMTRCMRTLCPHSTCCAALCLRRMRAHDARACPPPQVRRAAMWLSCLNYQLSDDNLPIAESPFATVCTPYVFNKYRGIFGLSGSIGGQAELTYLASTYGAVKFEVPRFLDTCTGDARKVVTNHGVEVMGSEAALVARVVTLCEQWVQRVPVLVITSGPEELLRVQTAVMQSRGVVAEEVGTCMHPMRVCGPWRVSLASPQAQAPTPTPSPDPNPNPAPTPTTPTLTPDSRLPTPDPIRDARPNQVQRFSLFDANGRSLKGQWETLIADATKRLGGPADNRCRVTVTDRFGGRGHDYQVTGIYRHRVAACVLEGRSLDGRESQPGARRVAAWVTQVDRPVSVTR